MAGCTVPCSFLSLSPMSNPPPPVGSGALGPRSVILVHPSIVEWNARADDQPQLPRVERCLHGERFTWIKVEVGMTFPWGTCAPFPAVLPTIVPAISSGPIAQLMLATPAPLQAGNSSIQITCAAETAPSSPPAAVVVIPRTLQTWDCRRNFPDPPPKGLRTVGCRCLSGVLPGPAPDQPLPWRMLCL